MTTYIERDGDGGTSSALVAIVAIIAIIILLGGVAYKLGYLPMNGNKDSNTPININVEVPSSAASGN